jgi:hypothetical protein
VLPVVLIAMAIGSGPALGQFAPPVPPNTSNFGTGRIDASMAYQYIGQTISACGRAWQPDPQSPAFVMGVSPYEIVVFLDNPQHAAYYSNQIVCATGLVQQPQQFIMGVRAAMYYPQDVEIVEQPRPAQSCGPCVRPNGMISGRACYGGPPVRPPFPPCPQN